jgi:hypothetical protein
MNTSLSRANTSGQLNPLSLITGLSDKQGMGQVPAPSELRLFPSVLSNSLPYTHTSTFTI